MPTRQSPILLIDDDVDFCALAASMAEYFAIPLECRTSAWGLAGADFRRYRAVVLDYKLGRENGVALASAIAQVASDIPVLLISGEKAKTEASDGWPKSIRGFLPKFVGLRSILLSASQLAPNDARVTPDAKDG